MLELVKLVPLALDCSDNDKETLMILFVSNILYVISNLIFFNLNHRLILRQCLILLKGIKIAEAYSLFSLNSQRIGSY